MISVVVPVHNGADSLRRCLESMFASGNHPPEFECIVVDDASSDDSAGIAKSFPVRVVQIREGPMGPAYARNRGAEVAAGDLLFFVDADVVLQSTTLERLSATFARHPEIDAVFGSYDDHPEAGDFLSRYRNLLHHFIHQHARAEAGTFWSGCGAIRREVFLALGGFDAVHHPRPSMEDVELGYRLRARGHRILLDKQMQVQHLKRWTLRRMIETDVFDRAIPWTRLILRERRLPNDLNLRVSHLVSAILVAVALMYLGLVAFFHNVVLLPVVVALFLLAAGNWCEERPHFQMSRVARGLTYAFIAAVSVLAIASDVARMLPPLGLVLAGSLVDQWVPESRGVWESILFTTLVLGFGAGTTVLLGTYPGELVAPLLGITAAIVLINLRLYAFFARKQGLMFMLAVIPFHVLYYVYSTAAFAVGTGLYVWERMRISPKGKRPPSNK